MKQYLSAVLGLLISSNIAFAQEPKWQKVRLSDSGTVEFPGSPTEKEQETKLGQAQTYLLKDSGTIYMAMVQENALEPESSNAEIKQFYTGALQGGGMQVLTKKEFTVNGFTGIEAQVTIPNRPSLPAIKFMRVIAINGTAYIQNFWTSAEQNERLTTARQHFFSSLQPRVDKISQVTDGFETNSASYRLGKLLGKLAFYGFLIFIFFKIIRRFDKPKNTK